MERVAILILAKDPAVRSKVAADIADGLECAIFTASDVRGALELLRRERPVMMLAGEEFAVVHGQPLADVVASVSPATRVQVIVTPRAAPAGA